MREQVVISVQLLSRIRLFATPWTTARQASLSITNSRSLRKLMSIETMIVLGMLNLWSWVDIHFSWCTLHTGTLEFHKYNLITLPFTLNRWGRLRALNRSAVIQCWLYGWQQTVEERDGYCNNADESWWCFGPGWEWWRWWGDFWR